jgi:simple sugar transport system permease protein
VVLEPNHAMAGYWGILAGTAAGVLFSLLHAYASIHWRADQVVSGTALNILAGGLTIYLCQIFFDQQRSNAFATGISKVTVPGLGRIPGLGPLLFRDVYPTSLIALLLVLLTWFALNRTPFGLRLRACGEHPQAAASMGVNVVRMRYVGVLLSGALAGLGGSALILTQDIQYSLTSVHGTGFIALACLIFGKWNPFGVLGAGLFFGFSLAASIYAKDIPLLAQVPQDFFFMLPYVLTVLALVVFSGKSVGPKAAGEIYDPGKR